MRLSFTLLLITIFYIQNLTAQEPTVGVLYHDNTKAFDGFTMFFGGQRNVYLVDNCGELINKWENTLPSGATAYLLPNGNLLRAVRLGQTTFQGGGIGGGVEMLDWNNNVLWQFDYHEDNSHHQHHDIEPMPNGNVLILAWEHRTGMEALAKGRMSDKAVWPTQIVEVQPQGARDGKIVWEWHLWDHTIQDINDSLPNFGEISQHPERFDVNLGAEGDFPGTNRGIDWLHCNSVEYIEEYDWILLSSKHMHEIYIIDHSTTSDEAAGHTGGNYGKGGDFLYRWGNPENYRRGTSANKVLAGQHDAIWIPGKGSTRPQIMLVNNGKDGRVDVLAPPLTSQGKFVIQNGLPYGPFNLSWSHEAEIKAAIGCSARRLPNGNTISCDAQTGIMKEVTLTEEVVWKYQNPVRGVPLPMPLEQGTPINTGSGLGSFRAEKYGRDYITNTTLDISPKGKLELNPYPDSCVILSQIDTTMMPVDTLIMPIDSMMNPIDTASMPMDSMMSPVDTLTMPMDSMMNPVDTITMPMDSMMMDSIISVETILDQTIKVYPIPTNSLIKIENSYKPITSIELINLNGQTVLRKPYTQVIDVQDLSNGIYLIRMYNQDVLLDVRKLVKQ